MLTDLRWRDYVLRAGDAALQMWDALLADERRRVLYILGLGFDPRMCAGPSALLSGRGKGRQDVMLLAFEEGAESPSQAHRALRLANEDRLKQIVIANECELMRRTVMLVSADNRRIGGRSIAREFDSQDAFIAYTDIVVDISALPRGLYLPLLAKLLDLFDRGWTDSVMRNLHVVVADSPSVDAAIQDEGIDENATFLHGFSAAEFEREATREQPRVWLPVLGRGQRVQLDRILALVAPDEICPVLPSPSHNPREGDDLILEYRDLLFDQLRVEPRNIIHASESNPFEVYRQLVRSVRHYKSALTPLNGCKAALSAMSSKLASLGALLAAYELRNGPGDERVDVAFAHVEAQGYSLNTDSVAAPPTLYSVWIAGECHAS